MAYEDFFGYLPLKDALLLSCGSVTPLPTLADATEWIEKYGNEDGYLYAEPTHTRRSVDGGQTWEKVPKSVRPGLLHRLPPTHKLDLPNHPDDRKAARYGLAGFIMHMLAFLYARRCHFYDWWLDGRVPLKSTSDHNEPRLTDAVFCLDAGIAAWSSWPDRQKTVAINALFLKPRTEIYELEWERFQAEYQVFDALYSIARDLGKVADGPHATRIPRMCAQFAIPCDQARVETIVRLRNDLLHEAMWAGGMPGEARGDEGFLSSFWLNGLSTRLALALMGVTGPYVQSPWWGMVWTQFRIHR